MDTLNPQRGCAFVPQHKSVLDYHAADHLAEIEIVIREDSFRGSGCGSGLRGQAREAKQDTDGEAMVGTRHGLQQTRERGDAPRVPPSSVSIDS